jgi:hypothetical protein
MPEPIKIQESGELTSGDDVAATQPFFFAIDDITNLAMKVLDGQDRDPHAVVLKKFKNFPVAPTLVGSIYFLNAFVTEPTAR